MAILTPEQLAAKLPTSIALVGSPKTGKTQSIATLHAYYKRKGLPSRIHILDYDEDGADTLIRIAREQRWLDDLFVHRITQPRGETMSLGASPARTKIEYELAVQELNSFNRYLDGPVWRKGEEIGAIVHDSYTELVRILWDGILSMRGREIAGEGPGTDDIEWTEWRLLREKVEEYIRVAKSFPCDRVFTFHEEVIMEEIRGGDPKKPTIVTTGRRLRIPIGGTRRLSSSIGKYFSVMLYTTIDDTKTGADRFQWITRPTREITSAGSRLRPLMPETVTQDFANVLE